MRPGPCVRPPRRRRCRSHPQPDRRPGHGAPGAAGRELRSGSRPEARLPQPVDQQRLQSRPALRAVPGLPRPVTRVTLSRSENSTDVPSASPRARPISAPLARSRAASDPIRSLRSTRCRCPVRKGTRGARRRAGKPGRGAAEYGGESKLLRRTEWSTCIADSRWGEPGVPRGCHDDPRASLHQDETVAGQRHQDFKTLLTRRADSDYGDFESVSRSEAADSVVRADRLLNQIDMLRKRLAAEL